MYRYRIDVLAQRELEQVGDIYEGYFVDLGDYEKGVVWADRSLTLLIIECDRVRT